MEFTKKVEPKNTKGKWVVIPPILKKERRFKKEIEIKRVIKQP
jgi:hypothetical protein